MRIRSDDRSSLWKTNQNADVAAKVLTKKLKDDLKKHTEQ